MTGVLIKKKKKRKFGDRCTQGECHVDRKAEIRVASTSTSQGALTIASKPPGAPGESWSTSPSALKRSQLSLHLDLRLPAPRAMSL